MGSTFSRDNLGWKFQLHHWVRNAKLGGVAQFLCVHGIRNVSQAPLGVFFQLQVQLCSNSRCRPISSRRSWRVVMLGHCNRHREPGTLTSFGHRDCKVKPDDRICLFIGGSWSRPFSLEMSNSIWSFNIRPDEPSPTLFPLLWFWEL